MIIQALISKRLMLSVHLEPRLHAVGLVGPRTGRDHGRALVTPSAFRGDLEVVQGQGGLGELVILLQIQMNAVPSSRSATAIRKRIQKPFSWLED